VFVVVCRLNKGQVVVLNAINAYSHIFWLLRKDTRVVF